MVASVNSVNGISQYSCGNIKRSGEIIGGRIVYSVFDSKGSEVQKLSVPREEADAFENSYTKIMQSAPKIKKYVAENSSEKDLRHRRTIVRNVVATCAAVGAAAPIMLLWHSNSMTKKILGTIGGVMVGLAAGFVASLYIMTPPGTSDFIKAHRKISKLDIQPVLDEKA